MFSSNVLDITNINPIRVTIRINGPPILLSKQTKKKRGIVTAVPFLPSGEEKSRCFARSQRSLLLEQVSKILTNC